MASKPKMKTPPTDPVLDLLSKLSKLRAPYVVNKKEVEAAVQRYNALIGENSDLKQLKDVPAKSEQPSQVEQQPNSSGKRSEEKYKGKYEREVDKVHMLEKQIEELRSRLSKVTGEKMKEGNSNVTDLSDPHRPTKLAENFKELYDNEWTNAFDSLHERIKDDMTIIEILANITKEIDKFCSAVADQQMYNMKVASESMIQKVVRPVVEYPEKTKLSEPKNQTELSEEDNSITERHIKDIRKELAYLSARGVVELFDTKVMPGILKHYNISEKNDSLDVFIDMTTRCVWMMKIQDKPVVMVWLNKDEVVDKKFTFYTNRGTRVAITVWPALLLHENGPLMCKGVIQGKD